MTNSERPSEEVEPDDGWDDPDEDEPVVDPGDRTPPHGDPVEDDED